MRLVRNWKQAGKWFSTWAMSAAVAMQGAWMAMPVEWKSVVPDNLVMALTIAALVLGFIGRLVDQGLDDA